eukprot:CAMPEP_0174694404 /NCGR_PEP_ID=MMETSP1094-20130205/1023_1 /TAXON_ID=156173 /ORGANISM="Chrysochromulina brevifilum, Strain UTEX LB 985" /LENGTH=227 /DNA_ID=CAMNT_0015890649 /DNA_START=169 /DNA_END=852 /DNA_ORIENTATION=+
MGRPGNGCRLCRGGKLSVTAVPTQIVARNLGAGEEANRVGTAKGLQVTAETRRSRTEDGLWLAAVTLRIEVIARRVSTSYVPGPGVIKRSGTLVDAPQGGWYFGELRRLCRVAKEMPVLRKLEMSKWPSRRGDNVMPGEGAIIPLSNVSDSCVAGAPSSVVEGRAFRGLRVTAGDSAAAMPFGESISALPPPAAGPLKGARSPSERNLVQRGSQAAKSAVAVSNRLP